MIRQIVFIICLFSPILTFSNNRADSLRQAVATASSDAEKLSPLISLARHYQMRAQDSTNILAEECLRLATQVKDYDKQIESYMILGIWHHNKGSLALAKDQYFKAITIANKHGLKSKLASIYTNLGLSYRRGYQQDSAFYYFSEAEKIHLANGSPYDLWYVYSGLGQMFADLGETQKAEDYLLKAYDVVLQKGNRMDKGFLLYTLNLFFFTHERFDQLAVFRQHWEDFQQEKKTSKELMEIPEHVGMYLFDSKDEKNYTSRLFRAIGHSRKINNRFLAGWCYEDLGDYFLKKQDYPTALVAYDSAQLLFNQSGAAYRRGRALHQLYHTNKLLGNKPAALQYLEQYKQIADSLRSVEIEENLSQLQVQYETEKKENTLVIKELELGQKTQERNVLLGSSILLALLATAIFVGFRQRIETNKKLTDQATQIQEQRIRQLEQEKKLITLNAMLEGQENERSRIAQDLHDGLGGLLTSVKAHFGVLQEKGENGQPQGLYQKTNILIDEACVEVRRISQNLMPRALMLSGLAGAIEDLTGQVQQQNLDCQLEIIGLENEPSQTVSVMLFRILQELTSNILKHAEAKQILIQLIQHQNEITLIVEDDGKGFDLKAAYQKKSLGLKSIESRVKYLRGTLDIDSVIGEGTTVTVNVPG
ncbi:MAG: hypothetical protein DHS20C18_49380 [Saprospiraceae bacterium]|nr:MAG: hypothetical protein DHS20C18_49380 [Saprospiraceae bacterium]